MEVVCVCVGGRGGVWAGASVHPVLRRAAQVSALGSDLDHANLPVAFRCRRHQADIERPQVGRRAMTERVKEGAGAAAPEELSGQYNKSSHAAMLFIIAARAIRFMSRSNINGFPRRAGQGSERIEGKVLLLVLSSSFFPFFFSKFVY